MLAFIFFCPSWQVGVGHQTYILSIYMHVYYIDIVINVKLRNLTSYNFHNMSVILPIRKHIDTILPILHFPLLYFQVISLLFSYYLFTTLEFNNFFRFSRWYQGCHDRLHTLQISHFLWWGFSAMAETMLTQSNPRCRETHGYWGIRPTPDCAPLS